MEDSGKCNLDEIRNLNSIALGLDLLERYGLSNSGCDRLQDIKDKLNEHLQGTSQDQISEYQQSQGFHQFLPSLKEKRKEFLPVVEETCRELQGVDAHIMTHLQNEKTIQTTLDDEFMNMRYFLTSEATCFIFTGNSGPLCRTIVNNFIGYRVLPTEGPCSSSIKISYGEKLKVQIGCKERFISQTRQFTYTIAEFEQSEDSGGLIEVFVNFGLLGDGLSIYTIPPGLNTPMEHFVNDLSNTQLRVIFNVHTLASTPQSTPIGAVSEDTSYQRAVVINLKIVEEIEGDSSEKKEQYAGHDTAVHIPQHLLTLKNITLDNFQIIFDIVFQAFRTSLRHKMKSQHEWLLHLIQRCIHHCSAFLLRTKISSEELNKRFEILRQRLEKIGCESGTFIKALRANCESYTMNLTNSFLGYLQSEKARCKMGAWQLQQLPCPKSYELWENLDAKITKLLGERLTSILKYWETNAKDLRFEHNALMDLLRKDFLTLEHEFETVEHILGDNSYEFTDTSHEASLTSLLTGFGNQSSNEENLSTFQKIGLGVIAPIILPLSLGILTGSPVILMSGFKFWMKQTNAKRNKQLYLDDPVSFVHNRAMKFWDTVVSRAVLQQYIVDQTNPLRAQIDVLEENIPKLIKINRDLVDSIMKDQRSNSEIEEAFKHLESTLPVLLERVTKYGHANIKVYEYNQTQIKFVNEETVLGKPKRHLTLWTEIFKACAKYGQGERLVTIKKYTNVPSAVNISKEESFLRQCRHPNICRLIATYEVDKGVPGFILEPHLVKARQELFGFRASPKTFDNHCSLVKRSLGFLEQVGIGLEYMHYKGVVHLELTLDSVMIIPGKDQVKLINNSLPRKVDIPASTEPIGDYVYIPADVLQGNIYDFHSDIYSLGLMAWELWNQDKVYKSVKNLALQDFLAFVTRQENEPLIDESNALEPVMRKCLSGSRERLTATDFVDSMRVVMAETRNSTE